MDNSQITIQTVKDINESQTFPASCNKQRDPYIEHEHILTVNNLIDKPLSLTKFVKPHLHILILKEKENRLRLGPETIPTQFTDKGDLYAVT